MLPWIIENYDPKHVMFVQDSAPAHGARTVQEFLKKQLPLFVWKDVDYWLWSKVEKMSNNKPHNTTWLNY